MNTQKGNAEIFGTHEKIGLEYLTFTRHTIGEKSNFLDHFAQIIPLFSKTNRGYNETSIDGTWCQSFINFEI